MVAIFSDVVLLSNSLGCRVKAINLARLLHRYYLQKCKTIKIKKNTNHTKYEKPNVTSQLHVF